MRLWVVDVVVGAGCAVGAYTGIVSQPGQLHAGDGPYKVSVSYPGADNFTASGATVTQTVPKASSGAPSGTVTFSVSTASGQTVSCVNGNTEPVTSGTATCAVATVSSASTPLTVTATYSGDGNYNASTSNTRTFKVRSTT